MTSKAQALTEVITAYAIDKDSRETAMAARTLLITAVIKAHDEGNSDQEIANEIGDYSRARIQQFRKGSRNGSPASHNS